LVLRPRVCSQGWLQSSSHAAKCQPLSLRQHGTSIYLCFGFALYERKTETQKKMEYRCEQSTFEPPHKSRHLT